MTHLIRLSFLCCCLNLLVSCRNTIDDEIIIVTTDPEFQADLFEQRDPLNGNPVFGLWMRSLEIFPCNNYRIESAIDVNSTGIHIQLSDVQKPDTCSGDPGPANAFLAIGTLPSGTYPFSLSLGNAIENKGILTVSDQGYQLSINDPQGIDFQNIVLHKIPEGLVWGYFETPNEDANLHAASFLADLKNITTENTLSPGFYGYFTLSGTGLLALYPGFAPAGPAQAFVRQLQSAPENLQEILQQYRSAPQSPARIRCLSTLGEF